jgi:sugar-specific transcriptional regulator TrmB
MSISRQIFWSVLFASLCSAASACDNPPLAPAVPDPDELSQKQRQAVQQEVREYYEAMKVYTAGLEAEIAAARGDDAPRHRAELIECNNAAVTEAQAVLKAIEQYVPLPANPGSEVALRRTIDEIARDTPNYDLMTPEVVAAVQEHKRTVRRYLSSLGTVESMRFLSTNARGDDAYLVVFEKGVMLWEIGLTADNKTSWIQQGVCLQNGVYVDPRSVPRCRSVPGAIGEP